MLKINVNNLLLEFIFEAVLSEHSRVNIRNSLMAFPLSGVSYGRGKRYRKRGIYHRQLVVYYQLDDLIAPTEIKIVAYRFGKMRNIIAKDCAKNWKTVTQILRDYPDDQIREKIY